MRVSTSPVTLEPVTADDAHALAALRVEAMRDSLERVGRFDAQRARMRLLATFEPQCTRAILHRGERVGFMVVRPHEDGLLLDHLYIAPGHQGQGIGAAALRLVFADADARGANLHVTALRGSDANRFYRSHGFQWVGESEFDIHYVRRPRSNLPPIVLDMDGVLLQTNFVKHAAMLSLFDVDDARKARISSYILSHGGVRRDLKIAHILRTFLGNTHADDVLPGYLHAYAVKLGHALQSAPLVPGVCEFIRESGHTFYLGSSAPEAEIDAQLRSRGLHPHFSATFGASVPKAQALATVREASQGLPVFFGDSLGDLEAAREAGTPFVAVIHERDNFGALPVVKLRDFTDRAAVREAIRAASHRGG